jgi:hypothetical protein
VLLEDENLLSGLGHDGGGGEAADAAADDDRVQIFWNFFGVETLLQDGVAFLLSSNFVKPVLLRRHGRPGQVSSSREYKVGKVSLYR